VQGFGGSDTGPDNDLWPIPAPAHLLDLVQVVHELVGRQQKEVPAHEATHGDGAGKCHAGANPQLHVLRYRHLDLPVLWDIRKGLGHKAVPLAQENGALVEGQHIHGPLHLVEVCAHQNSTQVSVPAWWYRAISYV